jgi:hypothetical protein
MMLLTLFGMRQKSWKGFHKIASRNVSNNCTVAGRRVWLRKGNLNVCAVFFYFLENKVISGNILKLPCISYPFTSICW